MSTRAEWRTVWWAGAAYAAMTVAMTWPMTIHLSLPYAQIDRDFGFWLWNLWWMKKALIDLGTSPFFTAYIFHPIGTSLAFHTLSPYTGLVGIPLQLLGADVLTTYNLLYLSSFILGGVGMFLLVRELNGSSFASFFAGVAYAFSPFHTIAYAWTNFWGIQWFPFALLFAVRLLQGGRQLDGIGLAITLVLATLSDWSQPIFLLLAIMVLILSSAFSQSGLVWPTMFRRLFWSLLLYGLLVSPLALPVLKELSTGDILAYTRSWDSGFELLGLRPPSWVRPPRDVISYGVLLGWVPVALVAYGLARGLDVWMKRFGAILILFFTLSLGEGLRLPSVEDPVLPLPFVLWRKIPVLGIIRGSHYFWPMVQVCVAVLAGHGAKKLWERMEGWQPGIPLFRPALGTGLLALTLVEVLQAPLTPASLRIHPVYETIQREGGGRGAILDAPVGYTFETFRHHAGRSMYLQTLHHRPLVGGYTNFDGRKRLAFLGQHPVLGLFTDWWTPHARAEDIRDGEEKLRSFLEKYQVGWVILRKGMWDPVCDQRRIRGWSLRKFLNLVAPAVVNRQLQQFFWKPPVYCGSWDQSEMEKVNALVRRTLGPPVWDDDELVAYRVP